MGRDYRKLHALVRAISPKLENDRPLVADIERVTALLQSAAAQKALGLDKIYEPD
jgi:histidine ammonia-lyase